MALITANPKYPNTNGWQDRHNDAVRYPRQGFEFALRRMLEGWTAYATSHKEYESLVGEDQVLGKEWEAIGDALRGLLNGQAGRFDCGTLDAGRFYSGHDARKRRGYFTEVRLPDDGVMRRNSQIKRLLGRRRGKCTYFNTT